LQVQPRFDECAAVIAAGLAHCPRSRQLQEMRAEVTKFCTGIVTQVTQALPVVQQETNAVEFPDLHF
jgi:hypothetical protein